MTSAARDPSDPISRATGERIEVLLEAASAGGRVARERAEELVRLVVDLYGAGLERLLEIVHESGRLDDELLDRLAADDLVAEPARRARAASRRRRHPGGAGAGRRPALPRLARGRRRAGRRRPTTGVVRLRMLGSCDGCPSSSVTLTLAVETAIRAAAPEVTGIEVEEPGGRRGRSSR